MDLSKWLKAIERNAQSVVRFGTTLPLITQIFGRPDWTYDPVVGGKWNKVLVYPSYGIALIPGPGRCLIEVACNLITLFGLFLQVWPPSGQIPNVYSFYSRSQGLKKRMMVLKIAAPILFVTIFQNLINLVYFVVHDRPAINFSPIEIFVFILLEPAFHSSLAYCVRRTMKFFWGLIIVLLCIIATWAVLAMVLLGGGNDGNPYYPDVVESYWTSLTVLNGANWPNPMIPSLNRSRGYILYYVVFVLLAEWGFLNLILALIISSFEKSWERRMHRMQQERGEKGIKETDLYEEWLQNEGGLEAFTSNPMHTRGADDDKNEEIGRAATGNGTANLETAQGGVIMCLTSLFLRCADLSVTVRGQHVINAVWIIMGIQFRFAPDPSAALIFILTLTPLILVVRKVGLLRDKKRVAKMKANLKAIEHGCGDTRVRSSSSNSETSKTTTDTIKTGIDTPAQDEGHRDGESSHQEKDVEEEDPNENKFDRSMRWNLHILMYAVLLLTSISFYHQCKVEGPQRPSDDDDGTLTDGCSTSVLNSELHSLNNKHIMFTVVVIRMCIVVILLNLSIYSSVWYLLPTRIRMHIKRVWLIVWEAEKPFLHLFEFLFVATYFFAVLGCRIWGGKINFDVGSPFYDPKINSSQYADQGYWPLNYNDMPGAIVTLFTLLYVNNMQVTISGFESVTSEWARVYFIAWYVIGPLFFMNILTALVWNRVGRVLDPKVMPVPTLRDSPAGPPPSCSDTDGMRASEETSLHEASLDVSPGEVGHIYSLEPKKNVHSPTDTFSGQVDVGNPLRSIAAPDESNKMKKGENMMSASIDSQDSRERKDSLGSMVGDWREDDVEENGGGMNASIACLSVVKNTAVETLPDAATGDDDKASVTEDEEYDNVTLPCAKPPSLQYSSFTLPFFSSSHGSTNVSKQDDVRVSSSRRQGEDTYDDIERGRRSFAASLFRASARFDEDAILGDSVAKRISVSIRPSLFTPEGGARERAPTASGANTEVVSIGRDKNKSPGSPVSSTIRRSVVRSSEGDVRASVKDAEAIELRVYKRSIDGRPPGIINQYSEDTLRSTLEARASRESVSAAETKKRRQKSMRQFLTSTDMGHVERAGVLIQFARKGEIHTLFSTSNALKYFRWRDYLSYYLLAASWALTFLRCLQEPPWMHLSESGAGDKKAFTLVHSYDESIFLSPAIMAVLKTPLYALLGIGLALELLFKLDGDYSFRSVFRRGISYRIRMFLLCMVILEALSCVIQFSAAHGGDGSERAFQNFAWTTSFLSVVYIVWFDRYALRKFILVLSVLPKLSWFILLLVVFILVCCANAMFVFDLVHIPRGNDAHGELNEPWDDDYSRGYYTSYSQGVWSCLVLTTSSNYPAQIMSVLEEDRSFSLFVLFFVTVAAFFMLDAGFATVNSAFQLGLKEKEAHENSLKKGLMKASFRILSEISVLLSPNKHVQAYSESATDRKYGTETRDFIPEPLAPGQQLNAQSSDQESPQRHSHLVVGSARRVRFVSGCVADAILVELFSNYGDWKKLGKLTMASRELLVNMMDVDGDGMISGRDYEHMMLVCRVKMRPSKQSSPKVDDDSALTPASDQQQTRKEDKEGGDGREEEESRSVSMSDGSHKLGSPTVETSATEVGKTSAEGKWERPSASGGCMAAMRTLRERLVESRRMFVYYVHRAISRPKKDGEQPSRVLVMGDGEERIPLLPTKYYDLLSDIVVSAMCALCIVIVHANDFRVVHATGTFYSRERAFVIALWIYLLIESTFKWLLSRNLLNFFKNVRNKADTAVCVSLSLVLVVALSTGSILTPKGHLHPIVGEGANIRIRKALKFMCIFRMMLFPRNIACFAKPVNGVSWATSVSTIAKLIFTFVEVMLCITFTYAQLGVTLFGGATSASAIDSKVAESPYGLNDFYVLNFDDMPSAFCTLFAMIRVSDFDVIASGFSAQKGDWARVYFIGWYFIGVLLFYNIIKSYLVGVFVHRHRAVKNKKAPTTDSKTSLSLSITEKDGCKGLDQAAGDDLGPISPITNKESQNDSDDSDDSDVSSEDEDPGDQEYDSETEDFRDITGEDVSKELDEESTQRASSRPSKFTRHRSLRTRKTGAWDVRTTFSLKDDDAADSVPPTDREQIDYLEKKNMAATGFTIDLRAMRRSSGYIDPRYNEEDACSNDMPPHQSNLVNEVTKHTMFDSWREEAELEGLSRFHCHIPYVSGVDPDMRLQVLRRLEALSHLTVKQTETSEKVDPADSSSEGADTAHIRE